MAEPDTLLIRHEDFDGGRFTHVGRYVAGNQFLGCITYASQYISKFFWTEGVTANGDLLFRQHTNCFAVLHRFDLAGHHLGTAVERVGGTEALEQADWAKLDEMIASLGEVEFCDIRVKPFHIEVDGITYRLIYERRETLDENDACDCEEWVMLEPNDVMFHPPWDSGEYST